MNPTFRPLAQTWKPGQSGNLAGRPRKGASAIEALEDALAIVEKKRKKSFLRHFVEQAYKNNRVAIALFNKLIPDCRDLPTEQTSRTKIYIIHPVDKDGKTLDGKAPNP